jgi:exopolyphosphatase/guanosine-5'-triphosphate,3'-diphosphate pyrophosphatase
MKIRASIDIGSNSILLLVAEIRLEKVKVLENEANVTGLGRDLDLNGSFLDIAMSESFEVLKAYRHLCQSHGIKANEIVATATEASRVAENADVFYKKISEELGINVQIISGEAEAYYSTMGILFDQSITDPEITIMDIGGASTELISVCTETKEILSSFSMPMGAVRFNNWKIDGSLETRLAKILANFKKNLKSVKNNKLYCVAGTMTSTANMYLKKKTFSENEVNGLNFKYSEIPKMLEKYKNYDEKVLLELFPFLGRRATTILSGIELANTIMKTIGVKDVIISTYGLRYGTLLEGCIKDKYVINNK